MPRTVGPGSGGCTFRRPGRAFSVARAERVHEIQLWTASTDWVISREIAQPPLVSEEHVVAIQAIHSAPPPTDGVPRRSVLAGVIRCGVCGRVMDSHWYTQPTRLPMPPRTHEHPHQDLRPTDDPLHPGRPPARPHPTRPRATPSPSRTAQPRPRKTRQLRTHQQHDHCV
jgi:hypothetical protein